jgi:outer membrane protein OmpA-like peptidoglycan-associated protein
MAGRFRMADPQQYIRAFLKKGQTIAMFYRFNENMIQSHGRWFAGFAAYFAFLVFLSAGANAKTYSAHLDKSQWYLSASIFECSIVHDIPSYGKGVFYHEAGEDLAFWTSTIQNPMAPGKAALVIEASSWRPGNSVQDLGYVPVTDSTKPIKVDRKRATAMMQGLLAGMTPTFTRKAWYSDESIRVQVNSINFSSVYNGYLDCVASLLPVNFRQVERTKVHFESDKAELTEADYTQLDLVSLYVNADSSVNAIYIDGHTDNTGRRIYNRRLSKERAEAVRDYLVSKGIPDVIIRTRYHGERFPLADNNSKKNKALNRRTTVRLERGQ